MILSLNGMMQYMATFAIRLPIEKQASMISMNHNKTINFSKKTFLFNTHIASTLVTPNVSSEVSSSH